MATTKRATNRATDRALWEQVWNRFDQAVADCVAASAPGWTQTAEGRSRFDAAFARYLAVSAELTALHRQRWLGRGEGESR